jgi:hypothetical protein
MIATPGGRKPFHGLASKMLHETTLPQARGFARGVRTLLTVRASTCLNDTHTDRNHNNAMHRGRSGRDSLKMTAETMSRIALVYVRIMMLRITKVCQIHGWVHACTYVNSHRCMLHDNVRTNLRMCARMYSTTSIRVPVLRTSTHAYPTRDLCSLHCRGSRQR